MKRQQMTRRRFIQTSAAVAGATLASRWSVGAAAPAARRTAADQMTLGKTGLRLSRLGFGTGSNNGYEQTADGKAHFTQLIHYAYDQGITYIDTAQAYHTFDWIGDAIKGLPREKLFIQSKMDARPADALGAIDRQRKTLGTDYIDSLLVHCMTRGDWTDEWKRVMEAFNEAQSRKWIRAKGVSCHSLPALRDAVASPWPEVHLVRINPQGSFMDGPAADWHGGRSPGRVGPVMEQVKTMRAKGRGVIGMKILGNGTFTDADDREKSIRFAMASKDVNAIVIGFKSRAELDEGITRVNRALAEA